MTQQQPCLQPGELLEGREGRYCVLGFVDSGGFAEVYRVQREGADEALALKLLRSMDLRTTERFEQERVILEELRGAPHVVQSLDSGYFGSGSVVIPFIVMEWLSGGTLRHLIEAGPQPPERAVKLIGQALEGLRHAHTNPRQVVHKDLKPENLMLDSQGNVKVVDFGIAACKGLGEVGADEYKRRTSRWAPHSVGYLAPEYTEGGAAELSPAVDVYQMGVILLELVKGDSAHGDVNEFYIYARLLDANFKFDVPANIQNTPLERVILAATAHSIQERYADADAFLAALEAHGLRSPQQPRSRHPTLPEGSESPSHRVATLPERPSGAALVAVDPVEAPQKRSPMIWALVALGALIAMLVGVVGVLLSSEKTSPEGGQSGQEEVLAEARLPASVEPAQVPPGEPAEAPAPDDAEASPQPATPSDAPTAGSAPATAPQPAGSSETGHSNNRVAALGQAAQSEKKNNVPARSKASLGSSSSSGSCSNNEVRAVVRRNFAGLKQCYESELQRNPSLSGKIVLKWTIDSQGNVPRAFVASSTLKNDRVEGCIVDKAKRWRFMPPIGGGVCQISYPFSFSSSR